MLSRKHTQQKAYPRREPRAWPGRAPLLRLENVTANARALLVAEMSNRYVPATGMSWNKAAHLAAAAC